LENGDESLIALRPAGLYRVGEERAHRVSRRGRPRTSYVEEKVMEFLEAIAEGMPTRGAAAIAQIPFETVRNWMSKNDPAFRPDFFRAFEKAKASAARKRIKKLSESKDWRAAAFWLERNVSEYARKKVTSEVGKDIQQHRSDGIIITPERMKKLSEAHDRLMAKLKTKAKKRETGSREVD
jgi:hypothetical protein